MTVAVGVLRLPGRDPALPLPDYATDGAAGMDLCANLPPEAHVTVLGHAPFGGPISVRVGERVVDVPPAAAHAVHVE